VSRPREEHHAASSEGHPHARMSASGSRYAVLVAARSVHVVAHRLHYVFVPIYVELRDTDGRQVREIPDPSGGTFDASGDIDRFIDESYFGHITSLELSTMQPLDPDANTEMPSEVMPAFLDDIAKVLPLAKEGPESRGLLRLRVMAERCATQPGSSLVWFGD
jgi:hypothetical protein